MEPSRRTRLGLESLELRDNPAVSAWLSAVGTLTVSGAAVQADSLIAINEVAQGRFDVSDGLTRVAANLAVTRDVVVTLGAGNDKLKIDLHGYTAPGNVSVNAGDGTNTV